jgi:hypothetical protein
MNIKYLDNRLKYCLIFSLQSFLFHFLHVKIEEIASSKFRFIISILLFSGMDNSDFSDPINDGEYSKLLDEILLGFISGGNGIDGGGGDFDISLGFCKDKNCIIDI